MRYLRKRLEELQVVDYHPQQEGKVFFGAYVSLSDDDGNELHFQIVGPDEIYNAKNVVSIDAPMARACLKKEVGDDFVVQTPTGPKTWYIDAIRYDKPGDKTE